MSMGVSCVHILLYVRSMLYEWFFTRLVHNILFIWSCHNTHSQMAKIDVVRLWTRHFMILDSLMGRLWWTERVSVAQHTDTSLWWTERVSVAQHTDNSLFRWDSVSVLKGIFDFHWQVEKVFIRKDLHIIFTPGKLPNYKDLNLWGGQKVEIQGKLIGKKKSSKCPTSQARIALVYLTLWLTMNVVCLWADLIHLFSMLGYNPQ